ncbi:hypothetical protein [Mycolicibacterium hippocampi]|uniref:Uncharacterized protein n=1 Tax=Mycolicibacterium hippocampi TaxID=659824 RepID=A0A7I9ZG65_9MYCO|nr:hypothetical protein [Mycolicibacterium hippocampi]GFH00010.1 hypothetical protein MHIP_04930 [Mycolicibacterium hippocampi]
MDIAQLIVNGLAALGAVGAAVAALAIATRDRRDRRDERRAAARAQARLVLVEINDGDSDMYYNIEVANHGAQPILDVAVESVANQGQSGPIRWAPRHGSEAIRAVQPLRDGGPPRMLVGEIVRETDGVSIALSETTPDDRRMFVGLPPASFSSATVRFTDANGNIWTTDTDGELTHVGTAG